MNQTPTLSINNSTVRHLVMLTTKTSTGSGTHFKACVLMNAVLELFLHTRNKWRQQRNKRLSR
uniref:Uncharacterized protein n=1 Tax=Heterorhabditis bacteriophora TaxID=37862 RepID=A0A1I7W7N4_HETBA